MSEYLPSSRSLFHIDDVPDGESRGFEYQGQFLIAIRQKDDIFLYINRCPHLGVPLEWQPDQFLNVDKTFIQCNTHGALFSIHDGYCVSGPCHGQHLINVPCVIEAGHVIVQGFP